MRPNRYLIRKTKNCKQFLLLFELLIVFSSFVIINGGVVRREIADKFNDDSNNGSNGSDSHSSSSSSNSNNSSNNDDMLTDTDTATTTTTTATTTTTMAQATSTATTEITKQNVTHQPLLMVTTVTTIKNDEFLLSSTLPSISTTMPPSTSSSSSGIVTNSPTLSIAKVTLKDIAKSSLHDDDTSRSPTTEVRIENPTTIAAVTLTNPTKRQQQKLQFTTIRNNNNNNNVFQQKLQEQRKSKMITDSSVSANLESTTAKAGVITTTKPNEFIDYSSNTAIVGESSVEDSTTRKSNVDDSNYDSSVSFSISSMSSSTSSTSNVMKIQRSSTDKSRNVKNRFNNNNSDNDNDDVNQRQEFTTESLKIIENEDTTAAISTELPHYNSFKNPVIDKITTESSNDHLINFDSTTISNRNEKPSRQIDGNEDIFLSLDNFDSTTVDFLKLNDENLKLNNTATLPTIPKSTIKTNDNYDISINEIKNSSVNVIPLSTSATIIVKTLNSSSSLSGRNGEIRRDSKFIKDTTNMTIPDRTEVWALASMKKNVKKDSIKNENLINSNDNLSTINQNTTGKNKLNRNDTTSTKILADWSHIMKVVENNDNLTSIANSDENALIESDGIGGNNNRNNDEQQNKEVIFESKQKSVGSVNKNNVSLALDSSLPPSTSLAPTKILPENENHNETLEQIKVVPVPSSVIGQEDDSNSNNNNSNNNNNNNNNYSDDNKKKQQQKEKNEIVAIPAINKNQVDDLEQQKQLKDIKESSKNSSEKNEQNMILWSTTTVSSPKTMITTEESVEQVIRVVTTTETTLSSSNEGHLSSTSNDSSPNKVNNNKTGVIAHKGTPNYKDILATVSSLLSTTEAIRLQTEQNFNFNTNSNSTDETSSPGFEDTTAYSNLEPVVKIEESDTSESILNHLPSTEQNLIAATTIRIPRTSPIAPKVNEKQTSTTSHPTFPVKIVTKASTNQQSGFNEREKTDNTLATGPENSIESNTIDRVHTTTPSDQNSQSDKVTSTAIISTTTTTTAKTNVLPVDTNSVEQIMQNSTTTHKTVPTKAEQEYSVYDISKSLHPTTNSDLLPTLQHHPTTHIPPHYGGPMSSPDDTNNMPDETDYNVIIAISVSVVGIIALILLVGFLYVMRKRQKQLTYGQRCRPVSLDAYSLDNVSVYNSVRRKGAMRASKRSYGNVAFDDPSLKHNLLNVQELSKFVEKKSSIHEEFKDVPQIIARPDEVPPGCEDKNRYANVIPLPETRVILQRQNDDEKTEYINANYVRGPKDAPNYYIACQAPLESTVTDFWRMIWEQNSRVIIMATDLIENGIEKCAEYLPTSIALDNHITFGDYQITLKSREVKDKYAVSTLHLKNTVSNVWREITHFWYQWPETGVPNDEAGVIAMLLEARSALKASPTDQTDDDDDECGGGGGDTVIKEKTLNNESNTNNETIIANGNVEKSTKTSQKTQGPLTVHCSPGTGRTGTIIACDIVLRSLEQPKRSVDIPQIVYYVRRGRASSVQTKEQYEFIYRVANMYASKISGPINDN